MKKILTALMLVAVVALVGNCKSTSSKLNDPSIKGLTEGDLRETLEEGFVGEDKMIIRGVGVSSPNTKGAIKKEANAKRAALDVASARVIEICLGANVKAASSVDSNEFAGSAVAKDLQGRIKTGTVKKSSCGPDKEQPDVTGCEIIMEIQKKGIKRECELAVEKLANN